MNNTKNTLLDLNDHLFVEIEKLSDDELTGEKLEEEIKRSKAIGQIATKITDVAELVLEGAKFNENYETKGSAPRLLVGNQAVKEIGGSK